MVHFLSVVSRDARRIRQVIKAPRGCFVRVAFEHHDRVIFCTQASMRSPGESSPRCKTTMSMLQTLHPGIVTAGAPVGNEWSNTGRKQIHHSQGSSRSPRFASTPVPLVTLVRDWGASHFACWRVLHRGCFWKWADVTTVEFPCSCKMAKSSSWVNRRILGLVVVTALKLW
jgi:hypothetical protein